jgi:hypothetical protein
MKIPDALPFERKNVHMLLLLLLGMFLEHALPILVFTLALSAIDMSRGPLTLESSRKTFTNS